MNQYSAMRNELLKLSFTVSQYSGPLSYGPFPMVSSLPDPGSAGGLQAALTARTAKRMRGEPVEKISADLTPPSVPSTLPYLAIMGAVPLAAMGATMLAVGPKGRARMNREVHDPRLYSNLRGVFESDEDRVAAHKLLDRRKDHTVLSAMREGFTRGGEKTSGWRPGLLTTDLTQNMSPDDAELVRQHVPASSRLRPGVLPEAVAGAYGGGWAWPNLVQAARQRSLKPDVPGSHRVLGALVGGAVVPAAELGYHAFRDTSGDDERLVREAKVRRALAEQEKKADVSPASPWSGGINAGGKQESSLPDPVSAGGMQADIVRRIAQQLEKRGYSPQTPGGRLARTKSVGEPDMAEPPGPSIAQVAKPKGPKFGVAIPGAKKGTI